MQPLDAKPCRHRGFLAMLAEDSRHLLIFASLAIAAF
jgi:hypothetical protein